MNWKTCLEGCILFVHLKMFKFTLASSINQNGFNIQNDHCKFQPNQSFHTTSWNFTNLSLMMYSADSSLRLKLSTSTNWLWKVKKS